MVLRPRSGGSWKVMTDALSSTSLRLPKMAKAWLLHGVDIRVSSTSADQGRHVLAQMPVGGGKVGLGAGGGPFEGRSIFAYNRILIMICRLAVRGYSGLPPPPLPPHSLHPPPPGEPIHLDFFVVVKLKSPFTFFFGKAHSPIFLIF